MEECGRAIIEFFSNKPTNTDVRAVLSQRPNLEQSFCVIQLLMAHFTESLDGLILLVDAPATAADVERILTLPAAPRLILIVSGETPGSCIQHWMISLEGHIICVGIQPAFLSGLAAVFSTFYNLNLQYQAEAACTLEFIQRRFIQKKAPRLEESYQNGLGRSPRKKKQ